MLDLPADLPLVPTDYVMMEQVFVNLISNSVKYAARNTPIHIKAAAARGQVADTGDQSEPAGAGRTSRTYF